MSLEYMHRIKSDFIYCISSHELFIVSLHTQKHRFLRVNNVLNGNNIALFYGDHGRRRLCTEERRIACVEIVITASTRSVRRVVLYCVLIRTRQLIIFEHVNFSASIYIHTITCRIYVLINQTNCIIKSLHLV